MSDFSFSNVALRAFAAATPSNVIKFDTSERRVAKFVKQMGIEQVHLSITEQTPLDLGYVALEQALKQVNWTPQDLDLLIFDTQSPDFWGGAGDSSLLHHYLNLREDCTVFDLPLGCTAFPYSLTVACSMVQGAININRIAIINGDLQWAAADNKKDLQEQRQFLFGECTGVLLLEKVESGSSNTITTHLFADGHGYKYLTISPTVRDAWHINASHFIMPDGVKAAYPGHIFSYMNGMAIHEFSTGKVVDCIKKQYGKAILDYDYYVFHQANKQIVNIITDRLSSTQVRC